MNETILLWALGLVVAAIGAMSAVIYSQGSRITKIETIMGFWMDLIGQKAAKILHSPHTPELDHFLKKMIENTLDVNDTITLVKLVDALEADTTKPKEERALAAMVGAACHSRLHTQIPGYKVPHMNGNDR